ncbi:MAG: hypothetical protein IKY12_03135 [Clostridia bacterium]|nr:hypothetical protein [Clostridia bacterium]
MSKIADLYNGNIDPATRYIKEGDAYDQLNTQLLENIEKLMPMLNEQAKDIYERIEQKIWDMTSISMQECFVEGFILGAKIMQEIYDFESSNFID